MWKDFKEFAVKGNAIDLAVGVIIGAAFGKIVTSIVEDLLMPPIGRAVGNLDFSNLYFPLSDKVAPAWRLAKAKNLDPFSLTAISSPCRSTSSLLPFASS